jgi:hypothetical protein
MSFSAELLLQDPALVGQGGSVVALHGGSVLLGFAGQEVQVPEELIVG